MRDINLFPRKSFVEQYRKVLLLAIIAFGLLLVFIQFLITVGYQDERADAEAQLRRTETEITALQARKSIDGRTSMIARLNSEIDKLKLSRHDWLTDMTYILGYLPDNASVTRMNLSSESMLDTEIRFATELEAIAYMARLQAEPRFRKLTVVEFKKDEEEESATANTAQEAYDLTTGDIPEDIEPEPGPSRDPSPETSVTLAPEEQHVLELLQSNPDDLSERLKQLLEAVGDHSSNGIGQSSVLLGEDSPFTRDDVLAAIAKLEAERVSDTPLPIMDEPLEVQGSDDVSEVEEDGQSETVKPVKPSTPYILNLQIPLSVKAVNR